MQVAALIGDIVASRESPDRAALQKSLVEVLGQVSERFSSPLAVTLGDEFQGRYPRLQDAVAAAWQLHVACLGFARLRIGLGWGEIVVETDDGTPFGQDGPAWWHARDAIERAAATSGPTRTVALTDSEWDELLNAYLTLRDTRLDELDAVDARILLGLQAGETQRRIGERLGLHESSISRRVNRRHLHSLLEIVGPAIPGFGG